MHIFKTSNECKNTNTYKAVYTYRYIAFQTNIRPVCFEKNKACATKNCSHVNRANELEMLLKVGIPLAEQIKTKQNKATQNKSKQCWARRPLRECIEL